MIGIAIGAAGNGGKSSAQDTAATSPPTTLDVTTTTQASITTETIGAPHPQGTYAPSTTATPKPKPTSPPPTAAPNPDEVTYDCAGNAPGVDISYGDDSSNTQGSLPLHVVAPLSENAQYYSISAQLGGSGTVTCRVTVHFGGETATKVGTATGGYNIASVEICSTFDGGFEAC